MKIPTVGVTLFHAGGQTDRHDEANSRFSQFSVGAFLNPTCCYSLLQNKIPPAKLHISLRYLTKLLYIMTAVTIVTSEDRTAAMFVLMTLSLQA